MSTETIIQNYRLQRPILSGDPYSVWRGDDATSGQSLIIQRLRLSSPPEMEEVQEVLKEFDILQGLDHPQLPAYLDLIDDGSQESWMVRETSEEQRIQAQIDRGQLLSPDELEDFLRQLLQLLEFLHNQETPLYHRDINPHTVTFSGGRFGFTDMGLITALATSAPPPSLASPDEGYRAPEQSDQDPSPAADLYGLAAVALTLITGMPPGEIRDNDGYIDVHAFAAFESPAVDLLASMLAPDHSNRLPTAAEALRHLDASPKPQPSAAPLAASSSQASQPSAAPQPVASPHPPGDSSSELTYSPSISQALEQYATAQPQGTLLPYNAIPSRRSEVQLLDDTLVIDIPGGSSATLGIVSAIIIFGAAITATGFGCAFESLFFCCLGFMLIIPGIPLALFLAPRWFGGKSERLICDAQGLRQYIDIDLQTDALDAQPRRTFALDDISSIEPASPPPNDLRSQGSRAGALARPGLHIRTTTGQSHCCAADISVRGKIPIGSSDPRELLWLRDILEAHINDLKTR